MSNQFSWLAICIATALMPVGVDAAFTPPLNDGYITIGEGIPSDVITATEESALEQILMEYDEETSNQIAVVMVSTLEDEPIEDVALEIGRQWGIGTEENDNGILLLIAYEQREMFLAVGYGLEGALPDIIANGIIQKDLTPAFREGNFFAGISNAIESMQKHIGGEYTAERYDTATSAPPVAWLIFVGMMILNGLGAFLGRTKSWWLGGVLGGIFGFILLILFRWWFAVPFLVLLGLFLDFIASRTKYRRHFRGGGRWGGGRGGSSGGFGGFGGGSFGGGGARGKW